MMEAPKPIESFEGQYRFLSNFWSVPIKYEGLIFPSLEHAYQAAKTLDWKSRVEMFTLTAGQAKRAGQKVNMRSDWEHVKISIMLDLLRIKFMDAEMRKLLMQTQLAPLIEGNTWGDRFWGVCKGKGENWLGRLLMIVRSEIFAQYNYPMAMARIGHTKVLAS